MYSRLHGIDCKTTLRANYDVWSNSPYGWQADDSAFETVGNKLVIASFMDYLLEYLDGKVINLGPVIAITDLLDDSFRFQFSAEEQSAFGDCIGKLIDTGRLVFSICADPTTEFEVASDPFGGNHNG